MLTPAELQAALATEVVPFDPIVAPDDPAWISASDLVHADDPTLTSLIDDLAAQRSTDDRVVAATLGWKGFAYLASLMPLAAWSRLGVVPDQHVHNLAVRLDTAPLVGFALREFRMRGDGSVADAVDVWWGGLMEPLIERWRIEARVGRRSLEAMAVSHAVTIVGGSVETGVDDALDRIDEFVALDRPQRGQQIDGLRSGGIPREGGEP
ncbi:MAG: hypothetical protein AAF081_14030, partial [Actinomycetota bacterium]